SVGAQAPSTRSFAPPLICLIWRAGLTTVWGGVKQAERLRPAINGRPTQTSTVNRAEDTRQSQVSSVFSRVDPACFFRPAIDGRPFPLRLLRLLPNLLPDRGVPRRAFSLACAQRTLYSEIHIRSDVAGTPLPL